ncbi:hypothetical protein EJB05_11025, partial [Eragrostis curvula]
MVLCSLLVLSSCSASFVIGLLLRHRPACLVDIAILISGPSSFGASIPHRASKGAAPIGNLSSRPLLARRSASLLPLRLPPFEGRRMTSRRVATRRLGCGHIL